MHKPIPYPTDPMDMFPRPALWASMALTGCVAAAWLASFATML